MPDLAAFRSSLDGELLDPASAEYAAIRRARLVVLCRSVADVVATIRYATAVGERVAPRGGGHCFAGRSSTDGIVLDLSGHAGVVVTADGLATIGAGARLGRVYPALHAHGRTLPAGCGATVGITGLTLGGGIGLLGRRHGLTCDRLVGAQVVLPDGSVVHCDEERDADLFWALRGAGGGQFGVVTTLRFATVPEPVAVRIDAQVPDVALDELVAAWQAWAPDAPDEITVNLTVVAEPGGSVRAFLFGASTLDEPTTRELLRGFPAIALRPGLPFHEMKGTFVDRPGVVRSRSEFFSRPMPHRTVAALLEQLGEPAATRRELTFIAMGGAYNRVAEDATAFAHRGERFLLEHVGAPADPWVDASWRTAHGDASGRVYPNFPDPALTGATVAYHAGNLARLETVKKAYDPHRFFDFPQAV